MTCLWVLAATHCLQPDHLTGEEDSGACGEQLLQNLYMRLSYVAVGVQEVVGTDEAALDAVVAADVELMALREEEAEIQSRLNAVSLDDKPGVDDAPQPSTSAVTDADNDRLAEIYERLAVGFLTCLNHAWTCSL